MAADQLSGGGLSHAKVEAFLKRALVAFDRTDYLAGQHLPEDFKRLQLFTPEDQTEAISVCLREITPGDYKGPHPPHDVGGEPVCEGEKLLQFVWHSAHFGNKKMCIKLAARAKRQSDERLVVVRLHEDYNPNKFAKLEHRTRT